jgi:hypothetical protein
LTLGYRLEGLAWLEGEERGALAVRFAGRSEAGWEAPQPVSQVGPGSQLALTGATLADGSLLLVWSAFDGEDDEILWSRRQDGVWSAPRPVAAGHSVPDINPAAVALGEGALVAWSRYDGNDYRLQLARFVDGQWSSPRRLGPAGSVLPSFDAFSDRAVLLFRTAQPRAWAVHEVDAAGRSRRRASLVTPNAARPVLEYEGSQVVFRWPAPLEEARLVWEPVP